MAWLHTYLLVPPIDCSLIARVAPLLSLVSHGPISADDTLLGHGHLLFTCGRPWSGSKIKVQSVQSGTGRVRILQKHVATSSLVAAAIESALFPRLGSVTILYSFCLVAKLLLCLLPCLLLCVALRLCRPWVLAYDSLQGDLPACLNHSNHSNHSICKNKVNQNKVDQNVRVRIISPNRSSACHST